MIPPPPRSTLFPYTTLFRSHLAYWLGDESSIRIANTVGGELDCGRNDVFVTGAERARRGDELLHVVRVEQLATGRIRRVHGEIRVREQLFHYLHVGTSGPRQ